MVERADELRQDIEYRRESIGQTVDQIENRVNPRRVAARGSYRLRRRLIDIKDRIMGNDNPDYPWQTGYEEDRAQPTDQRTLSDRAAELGTAASEGLSKAADQVSKVPDVMRTKTRGNPLAAGLIALGGGLLVGSSLPGTRAERRLVDQAEPALAQARAEVKETGREIADDLKETVRGAAEEIKESAQEAGERVREQTQGSAQAGRQSAEA
jgi:uncharacterized protein YjbJ (UPF0337 family)